MSLAIQRASFFIADFEIQFAWCVEKAGTEVAWRFQSAWTIHSENFQTGLISGEFGISATQGSAVFARIG